MTGGGSLRADADAPESRKTQRGGPTMASTQITVENRTDFSIYALLSWAYAHVGGVHIQERPGGVGGPAPSGSIPCEYVSYDLWILDPRLGLTHDMTGSGGRVIPPNNEKSPSVMALFKGARGSTSWIFEGTKEQGYRLYERP